MKLSVRQNSVQFEKKNEKYFRVTNYKFKIINKIQLCTFIGQKPNKSQGRMNCQQRSTINNSSSNELELK